MATQDTVPRRNSKMRRRQARADAEANAASNTESAWQDDMALAGEDAGVSEMRSCENCRRCKLKCSRSSPCNKCELKGVTCVYEQADKKRGPRPGYIEELYRRIDALEHVVLGQSLMLNRDSTRTLEPASLGDAMEREREHLAGLGRENQALQQQLSPVSSVLSSGQAQIYSPNHHDSISRDLLQQLCDAFHHHVQPWLPIIRQPDVRLQIADHEPTRPLSPLLQAVAAAASPHVASVAANHVEYLARLKQTGMQGILQSADLGQFRASLILQFILLGNGRIGDFWGLVTYPPQLALRAGLHLEDHHLTSEHREFRQLSRLDDDDHGWTGRETTRRLFWALFLQDHFAAVLAGTRPSFDAASIRRLLPCDGQRWQDDLPAHTREFVPASVAVQVNVFTDDNIGGLAYLIEATEIRAMATAFVSRTPPRNDVRAGLQEFLNLDLIMANWKARLPPRYQQASYDENGYMDHNVTLAHLTHNTTGILLYQWPRAMCSVSGEDLHSTLSPQVAVVKQAAKEVAKICTRFLLHRRYLVSPQFSYCQFTAARALLAYARWMAEPVDEDYETLYASLGESAQRWDRHDETNAGAASPDNLASMLHARLALDAKHPDAIDLTTPAIQLLRDMEWYDAASVSHNPGDGVGKPFQDATAADTGSVQPWTGTVDEFDRAMSSLVSTQSGGLDTRIFSWHDSPIELIGQVDPGIG